MFVRGTIPLGKESVTDLSAAVGLSSIPAGTVEALITIEDQSVRFWLDRTSPTASAGHLLNAGDSVTLYGPEINGFRAIQTTASAKLRASYAGV
jgi:hypothetical protein